MYHPLVIDAGKTPQIAPVVPALPNGAIVGLWFGFNGATLQLLDTNGGDTNTSPKLKAIGCVNGLPGVQGDVFGQVSWCNTVPFFNAADASIAAGKTVIPPLGTDKNGNACPSSRSFNIVDACPSDNLPTNTSSWVTAPLSRTPLPTGLPRQAPLLSTTHPMKL